MVKDFYSFFRHNLASHIFIRPFVWSVTHFCVLLQWRFNGVKVQNGVVSILLEKLKIKLLAQGCSAVCCVGHGEACTYSSHTHWNKGFFPNDFGNKL